MPRINKYLVSSILLSMIIIFFRFNQIPKQMAPDEVEFTRLILSLDNKTYQIYTNQATGHTTLYFYLILISFKLFGVNLMALRLPSALFGVLNGILIYIIFDIVFNKKNFIFDKWVIPMSFLLTIIFITLRWHFNFARFSFETTFLLFLELFATYFLFLFFNKKKIVDLFIAGLFTGLSFNSYTPGRIFFIIPFLILLLRFKFESISNPRGCKYIMYFIMPFFILTAPLIFRLTFTKDARIADQFVFNAKDITILQKYQAILANTANNIAMLFYKGDMNGRHNYAGKAALNPILSGFLVLGFASFVSRKKKSIYDYYFLLYFIVSLIPTVLTHPNGNPNMLRTFTMIPAILYFIGRGIESAFIVIPDLIGVLNQKQALVFTRVTIIVIVLLLIFSSLYELRTYFVHQAREMKYTFEIRKGFDWLKEHNFVLTPEAYKY